MNIFLPTCLLCPTCLFQVGKKIPTFTFNTPYMFIFFHEFFLPTQLLRPTLILGTPEYIEPLVIDIEPGGVY